MTDTPQNSTQEPINPDWDRVQRLIGQGALEQLSTKRVAIVGLGSGGGFVAQSLAMSGVGEFVLIDDDILEAPNVVRHIADLTFVGQPKVQAVAELIRRRNPHAKITAITGRLEANTTAFNDVDLVVVGVDGEQSKYAINGICRANNITAIYAGVYEKGEGGDVVLIQPSGDGPCYACWAEQLREGAPEKTTGELDYGMIGASGTIEAEPGLWLHVVRVASVQADFALNELLQGQPIHRTYPANTVILANVEMEILEGVISQPYSAQWVNIKRDPDCLVCGRRDTLSSLSFDALVGDLVASEEFEGSGAASAQDESENKSNSAADHESKQSPR